MKVLIADDERHIRNGLKANIDWDALGIDIVLTAEDGETAWKICLKERPEILISDIRMPGMDGLSLAERAVECRGTKKVILLSGYSEFEYAKKAISIGVMDYLLKPVNLGEMSRLLAKSVEEIRAEERQRQLVRQGEIRELLEGKGKEVSLRRILYGEKGGYPREAVMVLVDKNRIYASGVEKSDQIPKNSAAKVLLCEENMRLLFESKERSAVLVELNNAQQRQSYRQILCANMQKLEPEYTAGVSGRGTLEELGKLYRQSEEALKQRLYLRNPGCVFFGEVREAQERSYPLLHFKKAEIRECVNLLRSDRLEILIHEQFADLEEKRCTDDHAPVELCTAIQNVVFEVMQEKGVDIAGILDSNQELFQSQLRFSFLESYERWIRDYCSLLLMGLGDLSGKRHSAVISSAVDYIHQHYMENISLTGTAEAVHKSSSYFSCIFKKEMGVNFNEYLNQIRIEKAKQLLRMPDAAVYQVAEKVGFRDYKYFTKVFRKLCGCSPGEYGKGRQS